MLISFSQLVGKSHQARFEVIKTFMKDGLAPQVVEGPVIPYYRKFSSILCDI